MGNKMITQDGFLSQSNVLPSLMYSNDGSRDIWYTPRGANVDSVADMHAGYVPAVAGWKYTGPPRAGFRGVFEVKDKPKEDVA